jgi:hypothetical protein
MESFSLTRDPATSTPKSSGKRTSSPGARTPQAKRLKTDVTQVHASRDKRRRRKKKKQPMTRDSSGLTQSERTSSLVPDIPFPSVSGSTENCPSFVSPQSGSRFEGPSTPAPRVHSKPVGTSSCFNSGNRPPVSLASLGQDHVIPTLHDESKVRLQSIYIFHGVQIIYYSLSATTKYCLRPFYPPLCARSVSTYFTNLLLFRHAAMSHATAVLSIGSPLISELVNSRVGVSVARRRALSVVQ